MNLTPAERYSLKILAVCVCGGAFEAIIFALAYAGIDIGEPLVIPVALIVGIPTGVIGFPIAWWCLRGKCLSTAVPTIYICTAAFIVLGRFVFVRYDLYVAPLIPIILCLGWKALGR